MNIALLNSKMVALEIKNEDIAKLLNIDTATFYRKKNGSSDFYRREIQILKKVLKLSSEDIDQIFFNN